jgi:hypothetical protein
MTLGDKAGVTGLGETVGQMACPLQRSCGLPSSSYTHSTVATRDTGS